MRLSLPLLQQAMTHLRSGGLLAYPTESVWGLGCDPLNDAAVERLLALKARDWRKGLILISGQLQHFDDLLTTNAGLSAQCRSRILASWPGPNTWLVPLPSNTRYGSLITGQHSAVAIRVTEHPLVVELTQSFGRPIISTSANLAGQPELSGRLQILAAFGDDVLCLPGETLGYARPSTITDAVTNTVLR